MRTQQFRVHRSLIRVLIHAGLLVVAATPAVAVTGYHISFQGDLYAFDPYVERAVHIGNTALGGDLAVAAAPDGSLYAVVGAQTPTLQPSLHSVDPLTADSVLIGYLGVVVQPWDLTVDASGGLWMAGAGDLYSIDPDTGAATVVGPSPEFLLSIAFHDGVFYGIVGDFSEDPVLVTVDPNTGETTLLASLELEVDTPDAIDADLNGNLWVVNTIAPPVTPPQVVSEFWLVDPMTGAAERHASYIFQGGFRIQSFALAPGPFDSVTEIPTLGGFGMAFLAALLARGGVVGLRCRSTSRLRNGEPPGGSG